MGPVAAVSTGRMTIASIPWARKFSTCPTCLLVSFLASTMVRSMSLWAAPHLVMLSRTVVSQTSSKSAMVTPTLIFFCADGLRGSTARDSAKATESIRNRFIFSLLAWTASTDKLLHHAAQHHAARLRGALLPAEDAHGCDAVELHVPQGREERGEIDLALTDVHVLMDARR